MQVPPIMHGRKKNMSKKASTLLENMPSQAWGKVWSEREKEKFTENGGVMSSKWYNFWCLSFVPHKLLCTHSVLWNFQTSLGVEKMLKFCSAMKHCNMLKQGIFSCTLDRYSENVSLHVYCNFYWNTALQNSTSYRAVPQQILRVGAHRDRLQSLVRTVTGCGQIGPTRTDNNGWFKHDK